MFGKTKPKWCAVIEPNTVRAEHITFVSMTKFGKDDQINGIELVRSGETCPVCRLIVK